MLSSSTSAPHCGRVSLVGAGPGDPDLLTVRAARRIAEAEVVLHDHLVSAEILSLATGRLRDVGKVGGGHRTRQEVINQLLVDEARAGHDVVRLKGGDPFVFGRGGEEALFLAAHDVPFDVVPGISSAVAAAGAASIPVTHRGVATHFSVVTAVGATADGSPLHEKWRALAATGGTVVFMMCLARVDRVVEEMRQAGLPDTTRIALVSAATTPRQHTVSGTLADIVARVAASGVGSPATVIVGDVVGVREELLALQSRTAVHARSGTG